MKLVRIHVVTASVCGNASRGLGDHVYEMEYFCLSEGNVHSFRIAHVTSSGGSSPQALSPSSGGSSTPLPYLRI